MIMTVWRCGSRTVFRYLRRARLLAAAVGALALVLTTCAVATASSAQQASGGKPWSPFPLPAAKSVPGHPLARQALPPLRVQEPDAVAARRYQAAGSPQWPAAGTAIARLDGADPAVA